MVLIHYLSVPLLKKIKNIYKNNLNLITKRFSKYNYLNISNGAYLWPIETQKSFSTGFKTGILVHFIIIIYPNSTLSFLKECFSHV